MSEVIPIRPVVEVREAFTPSVELRNALVEFLDPDLDAKLIESLRATFLFRTWRERVMTKEMYYQEEHNKSGTVRRASERFEALPQTPMLLDGKIGVGSNRKVGRIVVRPLATGILVKTNAILDSIPSIDPEYSDLDAYVSMYVDIDKELLATEGIMREARNNLHEKSVHPRVRERYYVTPNRLLIREKMAAVKLPPDDSVLG